MPDDHRAVNLANWESRVAHHAASEEYGLARYAEDPDAISDVVRFDAERLGDIAGLDAVHLQCHIGTDTISLSRLGARVTGYDFSPSALEVARSLATSADAPVDFVLGELYDAVDVLGGERFDLVYTGVGAIIWLPRIADWARVVAGLLRPGGRLFMREAHPVLLTLTDPRPDGLLVIEYPYFEDSGTEFVTPVSYVTHEGELAEPRTIEFNHGIGEILGAVLAAGMDIFAYEEHDTAPWPALDELMEEVEPGEFRLIDRPNRLPHSFTLQARKR
ncbi:MAG TPA: class I SAM-dependent methyltransferase [Ilumatobacteraceae bacterium]